MGLIFMIYSYLFITLCPFTKQNRGKYLKVEDGVELIHEGHKLKKTKHVIFHDYESFLPDPELNKI